MKCACWLFVTPSWTVAHQVPLSMEFSRWEYLSGLPFPTPGDLPKPGIEPAFPVSPALAGRFFTRSVASEFLTPHLMCFWDALLTFSVLPTPSLLWGHQSFRIILIVYKFQRCKIWVTGWAWVLQQGGKGVGEETMFKTFFKKSLLCGALEAPLTL